MIATAHTADDVVEGVALHLLRGSGLAGLRGMPARRGAVVRPFLGVWRRDIESWLAALGETPCRDPSNAAVDRFARARVRAFLLPALERERPGLIGRIRRVAALAAAWQERLEEDARALGDSRARLRAAPAPARAEAYRSLYGASPALSRCHLAAIDRLVMEGRTGDGVDLPGARRARLERGRLAIVDGAAVTLPRPLPSLEVRRCPGCDDRDALHLDPRVDVTGLRVGRRTPGLRLRGAGGRRKLQDVLVDAKLPRHERDDVPLVFAGERLVWVPGIAADAELTLPSARPGIHLSLRATPHALHAGDRTLPAGDRTLPAGDRTLPAGDRALLAGDRALGDVWKKEGMVVSASPTTRRPHS